MGAPRPLGPPPDPGRLRSWLEAPDAAPWLARCEPAQIARVRADLGRARWVEEPDGAALRAGDERLGALRRYGSVILWLPGGPAGRRLLELDRRGHPTLAVRRGPGGEVRELWGRNVDGTAVGLLAGGAEHPLWGLSDRVVRPSRRAGFPPEVLTVSGSVDWDAIGAIPPLADPTRLPPGAGTLLLNGLAALTADQGTSRLRYRGPFATEQLFWALTEAFRFDARVADPVGTFLEGAEAACVAGETREAPLDWEPAPHERLFGEDGLYVQLRDGVEKVVWEGRFYYRTSWQGLARRQHRVVRAVSAPGSPLRFVVGLAALGRPVEDHLVLDAAGEVLDRPAPRREPRAGRDVPLAPLWREALGALLPLEATPLLGPAIAAVWPGIQLAWGPVVRDLVEVRGERVRLATALADLFRTERGRRRPDARRALAQALVREVLGLVAPVVRRAAAAWLEAQPGSRRAALLDLAGQADRRAVMARAAVPLARLLDRLEAGETLP